MRIGYVSSRRGVGEDRLGRFRDNRSALAESLKNKSETEAEHIARISTHAGSASVEHH